MLLFKNGKPVGQLVGFKPKAELKKALDEILSSN
jgi:thioredoxin-like negative regulator of GroEL